MPKRYDNESQRLVLCARHNVADNEGRHFIIEKLCSYAVDKYGLDQPTDEPFWRTLDGFDVKPLSRTTFEIETESGVVVATCENHAKQFD